MKIVYSKHTDDDYTSVEIEGTLPEIMEVVQAIDSANNLLKGFGDTLGGIFGMRTSD